MNKLLILVVFDQELCAYGLEGPPALWPGFPVATGPVEPATVTTMSVTTVVRMLLVVVQLHPPFLSSPW